MKIDNFDGVGLPQRPDRSAETDEAGRGTETRRPVRGDQIELSAEARLRSSLAAAAEGAPDVRQARIDALRQDVRSGTYHADPMLVARAILEFEDGLVG